MTQVMHGVSSWLTAHASQWEGSALVSVSFAPTWKSLPHEKRICKVAVLTHRPLTLT